MVALDLTELGVDLRGRVFNGCLNILLWARQALLFFSIHMKFSLCVLKEIACVGWKKKMRAFIRTLQSDEPKALNASLVCTSTGNVVFLLPYCGFGAQNKRVAL